MAIRLVLGESGSEEALRKVLQRIPADGLMALRAGYRRDVVCQLGVVWDPQHLDLATEVLNTIQGTAVWSQEDRDWWWCQLAGGLMEDLWGEMEDAPLGTVPWYDGRLDA